MKLAMIFCILSFSGAVFAQDDAKFSEQKPKMLEHISMQIAALENTKKCVEAADNREAVKKCHEAAQGERKKLQAQRIDDDIKRLEAKKKGL